MEFTIQDESPVDFKTCNYVGPNGACMEPVAEWGGRGRKPVKCEEHRGRAIKSALGGKGSTGSNSRKAKQAAAILQQWNSLVAFGAYVSGMPATHDAISTAQEGFVASAEVALESNPPLCDTIIGLGQNSGNLGLAIVYAQLLAAVGPVAYIEINMKRAARKEDEET